jgi:nucleoporin NUP82
LQVLCEGTVSLRERIIEVDDGGSAAKGESDHLASSLVFYDYDLGYLLLSHHASRPYAAIMDAPEVSLPPIADMGPIGSGAQAPTSPILPPKRPPYQVPSILYSDSPLEFFVEKHVPHRQRQSLKEQVRLSPATLDLVAAAHRILSAHTNALERAASDLFRRCERLQGEMKEQLKQLSDVAERIKGVSSDIGEDGQRREGSRSDEALDKRLNAAKERQAQLVERYESLRNKVLKSGGRPLSEKEKAWLSEVEALTTSLEREKKEEKDQSLSQRLETVSRIALMNHIVMLTFTPGQGDCGGSAGRGQVHCSQGTCCTGTWEPGVAHCRWAKSPTEATKSEDFGCHADGRARVSHFF